MELTRRWVAEVTSGRPEGRVEPEPVGCGLAFDSRRLRPGEVFAALAGTRDGHGFVAAAFAAGATFAITSQPSEAGPVVRVADVHDALFALARAGRARLGAHVVGITGSVGKTSTKDLAAAAIGAGLRTHAAPESFNNEIGVPVTVLGAPEDAEVLIVEMGARFAGNIATLCDVVHPEIGIITNIGITHAEHLGGPDGIARVKGELLDALPESGLAVIAADCEASEAQRHRSAAPVLTVGTDARADVRVSGLTVDEELRPTFTLETPWGRGTIGLGLRGAHHALNAAQAATVALHLGVGWSALEAALAGAVPSAWRMELLETPEGARVVNDAYNASPVSMLAALDALAGLPVAGRRIAVLGEMRELGEWSTEEHARVGTAAAVRGVDLLVAVGPGTEELARAAAAGGVEVIVVDDRDAASRLVGDLVAPADAVLVKASRAVGLEAVVAALVRDAAA